MANVVRNYQLTLAAAATRLSQALTDTTPGGADDVGFSQLLLSASGAVAYVGGDSAVTSTTYGTRVEVSAAGDLPVSIGPFQGGAVRLSDIWAAGAGSTLHVLGISRL